MYTQCPECGTVFRVTAAVLRAAQGQVCCGVCDAIFDALSFLTDNPDAEPARLRGAAPTYTETMATVAELVATKRSHPEAAIDTAAELSRDDIAVPRRKLGELPGSSEAADPFAAIAAALTGHAPIPAWEAPTTAGPALTNSLATTPAAEIAGPAEFATEADLPVTAATDPVPPPAEYLSAPAPGTPPTESVTEAEPAATALTDPVPPSAEHLSAPASGTPPAESVTEADTTVAALTDPVPPAAEHLPAEAEVAAEADHAPEPAPSAETMAFVASEATEATEGAEAAGATEVAEPAPHPADTASAGVLESVVLAGEHITRLEQPDLADIPDSALEFSASDADLDALFIIPEDAHAPAPPEPVELGGDDAAGLADEHDTEPSAPMFADEEPADAEGIVVGDEFTHDDRAHGGPDVHDGGSRLEPSFGDTADDLVVREDTHAAPAPVPLEPEPEPAEPESFGSAEQTVEPSEADPLGLDLLTDPPPTARHHPWRVPAALALCLLLLVQVLHYSREALAANDMTGPVITALYARLGSPIEPRWDLTTYDVRQWGAGSDAAPGALRLRASIVNRANRPQPYPLFRVTLLDRFGGRVARREFTPGEYLPAHEPPHSPLDAGARADVDLSFADPGSQAVGFELDVCLTRAGHLQCAADQKPAAPE